MAQAHESSRNCMTHHQYEARARPHAHCCTCLHIQRGKLEQTSMHFTPNSHTSPVILLSREWKPNYVGVDMIFM